MPFWGAMESSPAGTPPAALKPGEFVWEPGVAPNGPIVVIVSLTENQDMDGYELCSIIRADPATKDLPFLLLTGPSGPIPGAAARVGVSRVIAGKFNVATLVAQVGDLLAGKKVTPAPTPAPAPPPAPHDRAERPIMN